MSEVTILTSGPQARSGASEAFDASGFSTLRLDLKVSANHGVSPWVKLFVETAPAATGPWKTLVEKHYSSAQGNAWPSRERVVLAGFDAFVRLRWEGGRLGEPKYGGPAQEAPDLIDPQFVIGLTGDGQPDAT